jgi:hypothetical protein
MIRQWIRAFALEMVGSTTQARHTAPMFLRPIRTQSFLKRSPVHSEKRSHHFVPSVLLHSRSIPQQLHMGIYAMDSQKVVIRRLISPIAV